MMEQVNIRSISINYMDKSQRTWDTRATRNRTLNPRIALTAVTVKMPHLPRIVVLFHLFFFLSLMRRAHCQSP